MAESATRSVERPAGKVAVAMPTLRGVIQPPVFGIAISASNAPLTESLAAAAHHLVSGQTLARSRL